MEGSLFHLCIGLRWEVHIENGPSLCVGGQLCWGIELQVLPSLLGMLAHYVEHTLLLTGKISGIYSN